MFSTRVWRSNEAKRQIQTRRSVRRHGAVSHGPEAAQTDGCEEEPGRTLKRHQDVWARRGVRGRCSVIVTLWNGASGHAAALAPAWFRWVCSTSAAAAAPLPRQQKQKRADRSERARQRGLPPPSAPREASWKATHLCAPRPPSVPAAPARRTGRLCRCQP